MPRTVNLDSHRVRREAFLDVAQRLIESKGYEATSVQDVLNGLDTSKGAFYHYFDSKTALLDGVVQRFADAAMAAVQPIVDDPDLPALRKLERVFRGIATYKAERVELVLAIIAVWNSDGNSLVRDKVRRLTLAKLGPALARIIRQGIDEGTMNVSSPDDMARVVIYVMQGYQDLASEQFVAARTGRVGLAEIEKTFGVVTDAFERLLGITPGTVTLTDTETLRFWFRDGVQAKEA